MNPRTEKKKRLSVQVPVRFLPEQRRKLRQIASKNSQTPAGLIRLAVAQLLEQVEANGGTLPIRGEKE